MCYVLCMGVHFWKTVGFCDGVLATCGPIFVSHCCVWQLNKNIPSTVFVVDALRLLGLALLRLAAKKRRLSEQVKGCRQCVGVCCAWWYISDNSSHMLAAWKFATKTCIQQTHPADNCSSACKKALHFLPWSPEWRPGRWQIHIPAYITCLVCDPDTCFRSSCFTGSTVQPICDSTLGRPKELRIARPCP